MSEVDPRPVASGLALIGLGAWEAIAPLYGRPTITALCHQARKHPWAGRLVAGGLAGLVFHLLLEETGDHEGW